MKNLFTFKRWKVKNSLKNLPPPWKCESESVSHSAMSDSVRPHGLQPTRLLCPWGSPGKDTGVGCHALLQGVFPTQGLILGPPHCGQILYFLSHPGSHSLKNLPTPDLGDTSMSEAADYPPIAALPYSPEAAHLLYSWADGDMKWRPCFSGRPFSCLYPGHLQASQTAGQRKTEVRRAVLPSTCSLPWQGGSKLGTDTVTPCPAFCRHEMLETELLFYLKTLLIKSFHSIS